MSIWGKNTTEVRLYPSLHVGKDVMSICLFPGDADLDYPVKMMSVGFLHHAVTVFPSVINKYPGRENLRICTHTVSRHTFTSN